KPEPVLVKPTLELLSIPARQTALPNPQTPLHCETPFPPRFRRQNVKPLSIPECSYYRPRPRATPIRQCRPKNATAPQPRRASPRRAEAMSWRNLRLLSAPAHSLRLAADSQYQTAQLLP